MFDIGRYEMWGPPMNIRFREIPGHVVQNAMNFEVCGHPKTCLEIPGEFQRCAPAGHRPLTERRPSPARIRCAPSVQLVSYANGISALVFEMLILS